MRTPDKKETNALMQYTVSLYRKDVVYSLAGNTHPHWQRKTALRYHIPIIFENGRFQLEDTDLILTLDRKLGLHVEKET
ncbi:hypothetical protein ACFLXI_10510 [Chloroflexota bacterium]